MKTKLFLQLFSDEEGEAEAKATEATDTKDTDGKGEGKDVDGKGEGAAGKKSEPEDKPKYTDKDVDEILNKKFAKWQEKQDKAVSEAKKLAAMNATQKAEYERDQLQKQLDEYKRKDSLAEMTKTARSMLSESGISVSDGVLAMLVNTDAEQTKSAVDGFAKAFKDAVEEAVKERLKGRTPKVGTNSSKPMTKAEIMAIRDPELRQKMMLENRELFNF